LGVVALLGFGGRDVADRLEEAPGVEPVHPIEGGELDGLQRPPRAAAPDDFGLEQANDGFGERIVVGIADATDRRLDARLDQALRVPDADILPAADALLCVKRRSGSD
jgi:hypothetical protein